MLGLLQLCLLKMVGQVVETHTQHVSDCHDHVESKAPSHIKGAHRNDCLGLLCPPIEQDAKTD